MFAISKIQALNKTYAVISYLFTVYLFFPHSIFGFYDSNETMVEMEKQDVSGYIHSYNHF